MFNNCLIRVFKIHLNFYLFFIYSKFILLINAIKNYCLPGVKQITGINIIQGFKHTRENQYWDIWFWFLGNKIRNKIFSSFSLSPFNSTCDFYDIEYQDGKHSLFDIITPDILNKKFIWVDNIPIVMNTDKVVNGYISNNPLHSLKNVLISNNSDFREFDIWTFKSSNKIKFLFIHDNQQIKLLFQKYF